MSGRGGLGRASGAVVLALAVAAIAPALGACKRVSPTPPTGVSDAGAPEASDAGQCMADHDCAAGMHCTVSDGACGAPDGGGRDGVVAAVCVGRCVRGPARDGGALRAR